MNACKYYDSVLLIPNMDLSLVLSSRVRKSRFVLTSSVLCSGMTSHSSSVTSTEDRKQDL